MAREGEKMALSVGVGPSGSRDHQPERNSHGCVCQFGGYKGVAIDPARGLAASLLSTIRAATQSGCYTSSLRSTSRQPKENANQEGFHTVVTLRQNYQIDLRRIKVFPLIWAVRLYC